MRTKKERLVTNNYFLLTSDVGWIIKGIFKTHERQLLYTAIKFCSVLFFAQFGCHWATTWSPCLEYAHSPIFQHSPFHIIHLAHLRILPQVREQKWNGGKIFPTIYSTPLCKITKPFGVKNIIWKNMWLWIILLWRQRKTRGLNGHVSLTLKPWANNQRMRVRSSCKVFLKPVQCHGCREEDEASQSSMHSVCCCSLLVWRKSSLKKGTLGDLYLTLSWIQPGAES